MNLDEFRVILSNSKVDVWTLIHTAIDVASSDYITDFKDRRGGIVEKLFSVPCPNCNTHFVPNQLTNYNSNSNVERENSKSPLSPDPNHHTNDNPEGRGEEDKDEDADPEGGLFDDEQTKILEIKEQLEDPEQVLVIF